MDRLIRADQIDFSDAASTAVVSESLRFILPVPALADGGEPLVRPDGGPFTDQDGSVVEGRGIVFFDRDDDCWEVARGDGREVIIFSPITRAQNAALAGKVRELKPNPDDLSLDEIKSVIDYAYEELKLRSAHNSTRAYVAEAMTPVEPGGPAAFGLHRRKAGDMCRAVYVTGAGGFIGAGATPQVFRNGAVILRHGDSVRLVQRASFEETYRFLDGRPARVAELAVQSP